MNFVYMLNLVYTIECSCHRVTCYARSLLKNIIRDEVAVLCFRKTGAQGLGKGY